MENIPGFLRLVATLVEALLAQEKEDGLETIPVGTVTHTAMQGDIVHSLFVESRWLGNTELGEEVAEAAASAKAAAAPPSAATPPLLEVPCTEVKLQAAQSL